MQFWENVKAELSFQGITQKELAYKADLNYRTLQNWMSRDILPNIFDGLKISLALNVSVEYLVTGKNSKTELNKKQKQWLNLYNLMTNEQRELAVSIITFQIKAINKLSPNQSPDTL